LTRASKTGSGNIGFFSGRWRVVICSAVAWPFPVEVDFRLDRKPIELVVEGYPRMPRRLRAQQAAAAMRDPGHRQTSVSGLSPADRALVSVSVSSSAARGSVNAPCIAASLSGRLPTTQQYSSEIHWDL